MLQIYTFYFKYVYKKVNNYKKNDMIVICSGINSDN